LPPSRPKGDQRSASREPCSGQLAIVDGLLTVGACFSQGQVDSGARHTQTLSSPLARNAISTCALASANAAKFLS
ncbi:hypothetical protein, partial [Klebsiella variicola]|uniref:hypothetical protein n=1 Tax=Klebsiella variicola TaxID=244366 RepID=UPI001A911944